jgi:hypothetical protein
MISLCMGFHAVWVLHFRKLIDTSYSVPRTRTSVRVVNALNQKISANYAFDIGTTNNGVIYFPCTTYTLPTLIVSNQLLSSLRLRSPDFSETASRSQVSK